MQKKQNDFIDHLVLGVFTAFVMWMSFLLGSYMWTMS